jgi:hypothetical protein
MKGLQGARSELRKVREAQPATDWQAMIGALTEGRRRCSAGEPAPPPQPLPEDWGEKSLKSIERQIVDGRRRAGITVEE